MSDYRFNGPVYEPTLDQSRLTKQHDAIRTHMLDGVFRTLGEIAVALNFPEASVSAQLRHLRKPRFGAFTVNKQRRQGTNTWEYQVVRG